jgi:putative DNA primase/helicase
MLNPTQQFSDAIKAAGLIPPDAIEPGKFHKFPGEGKGSRNKAGWCKLFNDGVGGIFGDYASGLSTDWQAQRETPYSEAERQAFRQAIADAKKQAEAEQKARNDEAADKAKSIWQKATPAPDDHPYLLKKGIKPNGAKLLNNALLIPMRADGDIHSLQFIGTDGDKKFLFGGRIKGCYFSVGNPNGAAALCIAEGFATGATIHESTGYPVAIAFNAGNLGSVAKAMRDKFPDLPLILCADDDYRTEGNPGLTKATEAARAVGGLLAVPDFGSNRPDGMTDFNDMATLLGVEAVRLAIVGLIETGESDQSTALINPEVSQVSEVQANNYGPSADTPPENTEVSEVSAKAKGQIPDMDERPRFCVFDDWIEASGGKLRPGVWFFGIKPAKGESPPTPTQSWICSPLHVEAITFDGQDNNFGRLLRFKNTLGRWREWAMPMELLKAGGDDLRGELLAMGVEIDPSAKTLLTTYLQSKPPRRRMRCALQVGWCDGSFVLPDAVIGPKASGVIFQSGERGHDEHTKAGTLAGWQTDIAARAVAITHC